MTYEWFYVVGFINYWAEGLVPPEVREMLRAPLI